SRSAESSTEGPLHAAPRLRRSPDSRSCSHPLSVREHVFAIEAWRRGAPHPADPRRRFLNALRKTRAHSMAHELRPSRFATSINEASGGETVPSRPVPPPLAFLIAESRQRHEACDVTHVTLSSVGSPPQSG